MNLKIIAVALLAGASSTAAMAADLPSRKVAPAPVYAAPIFTWTGLYAGLQAGYAWDNVSVGNAFNLIAPLNVSRNGFVGGGHVGYLVQSGPAVFGLEGDVEGTTIKNGALRASLRGRLGFAIDRTLLYVTGGGALANQSYTIWSPLGSNTTSNTKLGWTVGAGAEYAISQNWSARLEYRYSDFGRTNISNYLSSASVRRTENAVRLGVSYHFNAPAGPVVAKY